MKKPKMFARASTRATLEKAVRIREQEIALATYAKNCGEKYGNVSNPQSIAAKHMIAMYSIWEFHIGEKDFPYECIGY